MKFSENWLREFVNPDLTTDELVEQLTMAGLEVESVEPVAGEFDNVIVAEISEVSPHPDADKLVVCNVNTGEGEVQVVCGAPNAVAGKKFPFARVGGVLGDVKIKKAKLRGVESRGMLCSERELGISENHDGLMELPLDAPVGENVRDYLHLNDSIIELDLTPNRSDCLGMIGLARETGVINNLDVNLPAIEPVPAEIKDTFDVELAAPEACPRFAGRVIRNIDLDAETPLWMQEKLRRAGMRPIDPVVDVTNYIMLELGQPMHAYDLDRLTDKIIVRQSQAGEQITLLDGQEVTLHDDTLLITDGSGPIGMAGIMGGLGTAVTAGSKNIFLESAFFSPVAISGRARSYGLNTDASHRFERGVDWQGQVRAVERATRLLLDIAGGEAGPVTEAVHKDALPATHEVSVRPGRVKRLLGVDIPSRDIDQMLTRLGFEHKKTKVDGEESWLVSAPSHRFDIAIEADLIEEISRVYGYNNLPVRTPRSWLTMAPAPEGRLGIDRIREQLVARGYYEAITYSFVDPKSQEALDPENDPVALANPISNEMGVMRTTLWPGLLKSLIYNLNRQQDQIRLFEVGLRFVQPPNQKNLDMDSLDQSRMLAGVACGARHGENWANASQAIDFYDVKGDLETVLALTGAEDEFAFEGARHPALHPGQAAKITRNGELVGHVGLLDPRVQQSLDIRTPIYLFELKTDLLMPRRVPAVDSLSRHPEVRRDIAIIVDQAVTAAQIEACIRSAADETLKNLKVFDVYQGKGIDPDAKSLALGLTFQHPERTLTDEEINATVDRIVASLEKQFDAKLRN